MNETIERVFSQIFFFLQWLCSSGSIEQTLVKSRSYSDAILSRRLKCNRVEHSFLRDLPSLLMPAGLKNCIFDICFE